MKEWKYVPVELQGMEGVLSGQLFETVFDYDEMGAKYELRVPISWSTIKAIHKAIVAAAPTPPGPGLREALGSANRLSNELVDAAGKAHALLKEVGEEIHWTQASKEIIDALGAALKNLDDSGKHLVQAPYLVSSTGSV